MRTIIALLMTVLSCLGQGGSYCTMSTWEPRNIGTKAGLVASHDPGNASTVTLNGVGVSRLEDRARSIRTGNLLLQSETFATTWTTNKIQQFGATDATNTLGSGSFANTARTTDPIGGNTADFIQEDNTASTTHVLKQTVSTTIAESVPVSVSCCIKDGGRTGLAIGFEAAGPFAGQQLGKFDLSGGTGAVRTGTPTVGITSLGSGWYLCKVTAIPTSSAASAVVSIYISNDNGSTISYNGDGTKGLFIWGASLVASDWTQVTGPTLAQGYQVTTTAPYAPPNIIQPTAANQPLISRTDNAGNLLKQSEVFSNASWVKNRINAFGVTDTGATGAGSFGNTTRTLDPLGGNTADFIQEDGTVGNSHYINQLIAAPAGTSRVSVYIKTNDVVRQWVMLQYQSSGSDYVRCYFNVAAGALGTASSGGGGSGPSGNITAQANGFYLCTLTGTLNATSTGVYIWIAETDNDVVFDGDNTSGLFLWGASLTPSAWTPVTGTTSALGYVSTTTQPIFPGLAGRSVMYFDGAGMYLKSGYGSTFCAFPLVQPEEVYLAAMQWTWTVSDTFTDGGVDVTGRIYQRTATPTLSMSAGTPGTTTTSLAVGSWGLIRAGFSGTSSYLGINSASPTVADAGAGNMGGFTLGNAFAGSGYANILVARSLICNKTNAPAEANYLAFGLLKQCGVK